ncbi:hypothetical protein XENORESO_006075 [Xenotaenia resolanae]|uniref:Uncharacterized protein n=1 Tax=Xenotaenia resolanae TaxID=208358 RepID=A0ABV0X2R4_9TELE
MSIFLHSNFIYSLIKLLSKLPSFCNILTDCSMLLNLTSSTHITVTALNVVLKISFVPFSVNTVSVPRHTTFTRSLILSRHYRGPLHSLHVFVGTQGMAVTYCCHGEEENKMMAIAQKCCLSLSALPSILEPGLMDEPCDWDVCSEATAPDNISQLIFKSVKKKHTKTGAPVSEPIGNKAVKSSGQRRPEKTQTATLTPQNEEDSERQMVSTRMESLQQRPSEVPLTRKELQDALPKIPPLSSFKNSRSKFVTFEEAELDFNTFITTGLGRSVEIIREFRGGVCGDQNTEYTECVTLDGDGAVVLTQSGERLQSLSVSSSSHSDLVAGVKPEGSQQSTVAEQKTVFQHVTGSASTVPRIFGQKTCKSVGTPSQPEKNDSVRSKQASHTPTGQTCGDKSKKIKKDSTKLSEKVKREPKRETDEEESMETEEEWSSETYWKACYEAWSDYYSAMSIFPEYGYQSYYDVAHNWMAAYRMNAVYMQELMKH